MHVVNIVFPRRRQYRCGRSQPRFLWVAIGLLTLLGSNAAWSLPDNPRDPPLPPSTAGNLYETGRFTVHSCRIGTKTASQATIHFVSNFARTEVSYWQPTATWSAWQTITGTSYACTAPNCLWGGAQVRIRGCDAGGVCQAPGCTIRLGVAPGGPPAIAPVALPAASTTVAGCVQTNHPTIRFEARWVGAPASGYPQAVDENGNGLTLTQISRVTVGGVEVGTYTVPAPTGLTNNTLWRFTFSLSASRQSQSTVQVRDNCLTAPIVQQVDAANNALPLANGQQVQSAANLRLSVTSGNPSLGLTSPALTPTQAFDTPFNAPSVSTGNTQTLSWVESGSAWDGLTYRSPPGTVDITGAPCQSGLSASYWITGSDEINLNDDTAWTDGPLVETNACAPVSPGAPVAGPDIGVAVDWQVVPEGTGWRVQVRAAQNLGLVSSTAAYTGGLWGSGVTLQALRPSPGSCPAGERLVSGICEACPDYQVCSGGVLTTQQWCNAGNPPTDAATANYDACVAGSLITLTACLNPGDSAPADARTVSYQSCVGGTTQNVTACVADGDPDPADSPCPVCGPTEHLVENAGVWSCVALTCPPGEFANAGVCEPCTDYEACVGGLLTTQQWCQSGAVPADAVEVDHQACVSGTTQTVTACVGPGDPTPSNAPCSTCPAGQRLVGVNCEPCPDYDVCSSGSLTTVEWCNAGNPPADATEVDHQSCIGGVTQTVTACVDPGDTPPADAPCSSCPSGQRLVGVNCEPCPQYQVCSDGSLTTVEWCNAGNPPADATQVNYRFCDAGTTEDRTACVNLGGSAPTDAPCPPLPTCAGTEEAQWDSLAYSWSCVPIVCPAGQRAVAGVCEPCPHYQVCSGNTLATVDWCNAGNPPSDATLETHQVCSGNSLVSETVCVAPGSSAPADSFTVSVQWCDSGTTRNRTQCVAAGATPPSDAPCSSCPSGQRLVGLSCQPCPQYQVCSGNSLATVDWCNTGNPPVDATLNIYKACSGGVLSDTTECVAPGGTASTDEVRYSYSACSGNSLMTRYSCSPQSSATLNTYKRCSGGSLVDTTECLDPGESGTPDESRYSYQACNGNSLVTRYACSPQTSATLESYQACFGNSLVNRTECLDPGDSATADSFTVSVQWCDSGTTRNRTQCVAAGATPPSDAPCSSCPSGQRLVGLNCEPCPQYQVCSGNSRVTVNWCQPGSPPNNATLNTYKRCSGGSLVDTTECLDPGESGSPDESRYSYSACNSAGNGLVTRYACSPHTSATLNTYRECSGGVLSDTTECLNPGDIATLNEVGYSYSACNSSRTSLVTRYACTPQQSATMQGYQACNGNSLVNRTTCVAPGGISPTDAALNTYEKCTNGVLSDTTECVAPGGTASSDEVRYSYSACNSSGNGLVTRYSCSARPNATLNTYEKCTGGVLADTTECVVPGGTASSDEVRYSYSACNGNSLVTRYACTPQQSASLNNYKKCSGGVLTDTTECVAPGGTAASDEVRYSYKACSGNSLVTLYACTDRADATMESYLACSGNSLVNRSACVAPGGGTPADATRNVYKVCSNGVLIDRTECLSPGESATPDAVRYPYQACNSANTALVQSYSCTQRQDDRMVTVKTCSGNSLVDTDICVAAGTIVDPGAELYTYKKCVGGQLVDTTVCLNPGETGPPNETRYSYQACDGNVLVTRYSCSQQANSRLNTYKICSGAGVLSDTNECLNPGDSETPDAVRYSYKACSGTSLVDRHSCSSRGNSWRHTYTVCSGAGVLSNRTECLDPGDDETDDAVRYSYQGCSGNSLATRYACSSRADDYLHSFTTCSGGSTGSATECLSMGDTETPDAVVGTRRYCVSGTERTERVCGADRDDRSALRRYCIGSSESSSTITGTCTDDDDRSATRYYCDSNGVSQSETISGTCTHDDDREATETYCSGSTRLTRSLANTCIDVDNRPLSCSTGESFNDDGCLQTAAACGDNEEADGWLSVSCSWNCVVKNDPPEDCEDDAPVTPSDCTASPSTGFAWSLTSGDLTGVAYADGSGWWAETYNQANPNSGWTSLALCKPCP